MELIDYRVHVAPKLDRIIELLEELVEQSKPMTFDVGLAVQTAEEVALDKMREAGVAHPLGEPITEDVPAPRKTKRS